MNIINFQIMALTQLRQGLGAFRRSKNMISYYKIKMIKNKNY